MNELSWDILEFEHRETERTWFWVLYIIAASLAIGAFIASNILFGIFVVIAAATIGIYAKKDPVILHVNAGEKVISVNGETFRYEKISSFSIDRDKLLIEKDLFWHPLVVIPIHHEDIEIIAKFLKERLPQKNYTEPIFHQLMEHLGL
ncbi:MAG: hypothetical protein AAB355_02000 [Patescibacteria group bacterium]